MNLVRADNVIRWNKSDENMLNRGLLLAGALGKVITNDSFRAAYKWISYQFIRERNLVKVALLEF